jgi:multiple sugar transport system permease protein
LWTNSLRRTALYVTMMLAGLAMAFPFLWMISTSLKTESEAALFPPHFLPEHWLFGNYLQAWQSAPFGRYFLNSAVMAVGQTGLGLVTSSLAAYALARMRVPGKRLIFGILIATLMIPPEATLIPNYITIQRLHWYNTYLALVIPFGASVLSIFLLRQAFLQVPHELYEAAVLDGCSHARYLWRIVVPLARSGVAVVGLLTFIRAWNDFQWPLIVTSSEAVRPVQVGLSVFQSDVSTQYQLLMAGALMAVAPIVAVFLVSQRQLVQGISRTGLR